MNHKVARITTDIHNHNKLVLCIAAVQSPRPTIPFLLVLRARVLQKESAPTSTLHALKEYALDVDQTKRKRKMQRRKMKMEMRMEIVATRMDHQSWASEGGSHGPQGLDDAK